MKKLQFNHMLALVSTMTLVAGSQAVYAQQAAAPEVDEIVISGFRQSILNSVEAKREADVVADVVDASALGSLPAQSIADALGRIPGVTTVRSSGHTSELNIRGMNGDFIETTLNGNEQASTSSYTASSRWMAFDQYPAELITQAAVYKSPKASLIEGGVAGTVEMKTVDPLTAKNDQNFNLGYKHSYNDAAKSVGADEGGDRFNFSYQGKFLDNTLGVALGAAHLEQPNNFEGSRAGADGKNGYSLYDVNGDGATEALPQSFQYQAGIGSDTRNGYMATVVFSPSDSFKATADYFKSTYESEDLRHGVTVSGLDNTLNRFTISNPTVENGIVTGGTINFTQPSVSGQGSPWFEARTEDQSTEADSEAYALNLDWSITDNANLKVNIAHSEGTKTRKDRLASMTPYVFGTATGLDANNNSVTGETWQELSGTSMTFKMNGDKSPTIAFNGADLTGANMRLSRYEEYPHVYTDEIDSVKVDFKYNLEIGPISAIETGFRISDRVFDSRRGAFLYGSRDGQFNYVDGTGYWTSYCADNISAITCKPQAVSSFVSVGQVAGAPDHFIANMAGLADSIFGAGNYYGKQVFSQDWTFVESGELEEKVNAFYLMADLESEIGSVPVTGNIGVRVVKTDVKSSGVQNVGDGKGISITDDVGVTRTNYAPVTYGPEYTDVLPSLNLNFAITDDDNIRFALAEVMGRPPAGQLKGGAGSWNDTQNNPDGSSQPRYNVWTKGSPYLDPFRANQLDLSYEHYYEDGGSVTVAAFWKDIKSLTENISYNPGEIKFSDLGIQTPAGMVDGVFQTVANTKKGGYIRGLEFATTQTFTKLPGIFSGLGATASYSYTESEAEVGGGGLFSGKKLSLPGLSKNVWSVTGFWDIGSFSTHLNVRYRDDYIMNMPVPGSSTPVRAKKYTTVDYQASYSFDNGIDIVFEGNNLTDAAALVSYGQDSAWGEDKTYGRNYSIGVNYKF